MENKDYIVFSHITKTFDAFKALDDVSLSIPEGCFMTLLGPSGCGKTTLMRQLAGFSEPDSGDIYLDGKRVNGLPPYKRGTPLVFQEYALFPHMTVFENISYGLKLQKLTKDEVSVRVAKMLDMFNLAGMEKRYPRQLSGGQQQRVAFARALIMGQEVLLLDEPLSNLDAKLRVEVRSELRQIQRKLGITVIYVTHDQDEALSMSDRIAVMRAGRLQQIGTPWEIYFRPATRFVADFVGTVNFLRAKVESVAGGAARVSWFGHQYDVPLQADVHFLSGDDAELVVRPECVRLLPLSEAGIAEDIIEASVTNYSFLGRYIRYWVETPHGETLIVDDANPSLSGAIEGKVRVVLDREKLHLLKREASTHAAH